MTTQAEWYLAGADQQPAGPYTEAQLIEHIRAGNLDLRNLCTRTGMSSWVPLGDIPEFAAAAAPAGESVLKLSETPKPAANQAAQTSPSTPAVPAAPRTTPPPATPPSPWRHVRTAAIVLVLIGGYLGYGAYTAGTQLRDAYSAIQSGDYGRGAKDAESLTDGRFFVSRACYLQALGMAGEAVMAEPTMERMFRGGRRGDDFGLDPAQKLFQHSFELNTKRRKDAGQDLHGFQMKLDTKGEFLVPRALALARLRLELMASTPQEVGADLAQWLGNWKEQERNGNSDEMELIVAINEWNPKAGAPLLDRLLPPATATGQELLWGINRASTAVRSHRALAEPIGDRLLARAKIHLAEGDRQAAYGCLLPAASFSPVVRGKADGLVLDTVDQLIKDGKAADAAVLLREWRCQSSESRERVIKASYRAAAGLAGTDHAAAAKLVRDAMAMDKNRKLTAEEDFLVMAFTPPSDDKLEQCRKLAGTEQDPARRTSLLVTVAQDALALSRKARGDQAAAYRKTAADAVRQLLADYPSAQGLDALVVSVSQALVAAGEEKEAIDLSRYAAEQIRDKASQEKIEAISSGLRPVPAFLADAEERANAAAPILHAKSTDDLADFERRPDHWKILWLGPGCTVSSLGSTRTTDIQEWVRAGGILWTDGDLLELFGSVARPSRGIHTCVPGPKSRGCPAVIGCSKVRVQVGDESLAMTSPQAVALLVDRNQPIWSVLKYGKGVVSDVKDVAGRDEGSGRFRAQFMLFCARLPVPGDSAPVRERVRQRLQEALGQNEQPAVEELSKRFHIPVPPEPTASVEQITASINAKIEQQVEARIPIPDRQQLTQRYRQMFPPIVEGAKVKLQLARGGTGATVEGTVHEIRDTVIRVGDRRVPLRDLSDADRLRINPDSYERALRQSVDSQIQKATDARKRAAIALREKALPAALQAAGYVRPEGEWITTRDQVTQRLKDLWQQQLAEDNAAARTQIEREEFASAGFVSRDGEWVWIPPLQ